MIEQREKERGIEGKRDRERQIDREREKKREGENELQRKRDIQILETERENNILR